MSFPKPPDRLALALFDPLHLKEFEDRAAEVLVREQIKRTRLEDMKDSGPGWVAFWDGEIIAAGGFVEIYGQGSSRASAWIMMLPMPAVAALALFKAVRVKLETAPYRRIECNVQCGFTAGKRWARLLGFRVETRFKAQWFPDGQGATEYVMTRAPA